MKRMVKLEGRMEQDLNFGFGLLGRVNKGGWFLMERMQVSPAEWKTCRLEVHMSGRAVLFKTVAHDTSEIRGGFTPLPAGLTLKQGVHILRTSEASTAEEVAAGLSPASWRNQE